LPSGENNSENDFKNEAKHSLQACLGQPNLDMSGMNIVFKAGSPDMLKQVNPGDQITFTADRVTGQLTVTTLTKSK